MVVKNNLLILFQNQFVEYIHKIQDKILPMQYDQLKEYYLKYKNAEYSEKMDILVEFINNLMEYNHAIISKDSSIFALDDIIYGSRDTICLIPNIDFRPFVKINEVAMWDTIQKMYLIANRIVSAEPEYNAQLTKNLFDSFIESMSTQQSEDTYKSTTLIKNLGNKFMEKIRSDKELYEFKNKFTSDVSVSKLISFVKINKPVFVRMIKHIIYISNETFNEECDNINVFDLRDDLIVLLGKLDEYITKKDNKMVVKGLLNVAKGIPFFTSLQAEYNQKMDVNGVHVTLNKIIDAAKKFDNSQNIIEKIKDLLNKAVSKIEEDGFSSSIEKYIDSATKQVASILPMLEKFTKK